MHLSTLLLLLVVTATTLATIIYPETTHLVRLNNEKIITLPLAFPIRDMFEAVVSCPAADMEEEFEGLPYNAIPDPEDPTRVYGVLFIANYTEQLDPEGPRLPSKAYFESTFAIMVDSPDYEWYPCGFSPTSYCPFLYKNGGYRGKEFAEATDTLPSGEDVYVEHLGFTEWDEGELVLEHSNPNAADIKVKNKHGRVDIKTNYDCAGWPDDGLQVGEFYQFNQPPTKPTFPASFATEAQVTCIPTPGVDNFWVRPHTVFHSWRNCKMILIWHQKQGMPDYVWYYPSTKVLPLSACGQSCLASRQCPSACNTCVNGVCAPPTMEKRETSSCAERLYQEIRDARARRPTVVPQ